MRGASTWILQASHRHWEGNIIEIQGLGWGFQIAFLDKRRKIVSVTLPQPPTQQRTA